jgi:MFS family permease
MSEPVTSTLHHETTFPASAGKDRERKLRQVLSIAAVFSTYFTSYLSNSLMSTALPRISADLNGMQFYSWAIAMPALATALATLIFGKLSDMFGRKTILITALSFMLAGCVLCALSGSFFFLVAALCLLNLGAGSLMPLCFSVIGDMFEPAERGKWAGLLSITSGITAFIGPSLAGWFVDKPGWRYIYWSIIPFILVAGALSLTGLPAWVQKHNHKIDFRGAICVALASASLIITCSWAGNIYPWISFPIICLMGVSISLWVLFFRIESRAEEPLLDPRILKNRTFFIAALAAIFSMFGITTMNFYFPLFLQGVRQTSATLSGNIFTPFSVLNAFLGLPAGFILAKTRRYKWIYVSGYGMLVIGMFAAIALGPQTPIPLILVLSAWVGVGLGAIPTVNALVVQYAVPLRLLGSATGSFYFFLMMGRAVAPAILGSVMNSTYHQAVYNRIPSELSQTLDFTLQQSISNPRLLLSAGSMAELQKSITAVGANGQYLFDQLTQGMRIALGEGMKELFLISGIAMLISFLVILLIPEISLDSRDL